MIALSDNDDDSAEYYKAQTYAKKIKRKRQERKSSQNEDSDTSDNNENKRRTAPRFKSLNRGMKDGYLKMAAKEQRQGHDAMNIDIENQKGKEHHE